MLAQYRCGVIVFMLSTSSSFFFHDTTTTEIYTLSLHDALPISRLDTTSGARGAAPRGATARGPLSARASYLPLSNLKDTLTLVRYALILPFCTCTSCCTTSAMRRSRRLFAA